VRFLKRAFEIGIISSIFVATVPFGQVVAEAEAEATSACFTHKAEEKDFSTKINVARRAGGLAPVTLDAELTRVARKHTFEMSERVRLHHTSTADMRRRVTNWELLGENVGVNGTVGSLHAAFMRSPDHHANVMHKSFERIGIGTREIDGRLWVTVVFEGGRNPGTTLDMASC